MATIGIKSKGTQDGNDRELRGCSVSRVLALKFEDQTSIPSTHIERKKRGKEGGRRETRPDKMSYNRSSGETETGASPRLTGQPD